MTILLVLTGVAYALFILLSWLGWKRTKSFEQRGSEFQTQISIIIPVRNEEKNIESCLNSTAKQSYPRHLTEIIVSDDSSDDQTAALVKNWIASHHLNAKIISVPENLSGKKNALNEGVKNASGELIVTTDADCIMTSNWLSTIAGYYEKYAPSMICGMVSVRKENNFLSAFQSLEQLGLTAIGAAGIYFRHPLMCNGANLAYPKKIFEEIGGYNPLAETASGDDTQLMFRIAEVNPRSIHFLKSKAAVVYTNTASTWREFFSQRKRWGSKVLSQKNFTSVFAGFIVFLFHLALISGFILSCTGALSWKIFLLLFALKILPEFILLNSALSFFDKEKPEKFIFPSQLIYPFYIVIAALLSQTGKYTWKARRVR
jgi:cellulose synthase/poly-beta-1,6-N-acetylglucosamine synthase-like glycosyltransferase